MIVAVKAIVTGNKIDVVTHNSRFWILARHGKEPSRDTTLTPSEGVCTDFTIPTGVTSVDAELAGAAGAGNDVGHGGTVAQEGYGARIEAILTATPGHVWRVCVGGRGSFTGQPSFNGGGAGSNAHMGGGGMTSIYNMTTAEYLLIAGGGGGGGRSDVGGGGTGGNGGYPAGATGGPSAISGGSPGGAGGTQTTGAHQFQGDLLSSSISGTTAGGGGGWWGGGAGGSRTGGGGGSSWFHPTLATLLTYDTGSNMTGGIATLRY